MPTSSTPSYCIAISSGWQLETVIPQYKTSPVRLCFAYLTNVGNPPTARGDCTSVAWRLICQHHIAQSISPTGCLDLEKWGHVSQMSKTICSKRYCYNPEQVEAGAANSTAVASTAHTPYAHINPTDLTFLLLQSQAKREKLDFPRSICLPKGYIQYH